MPKKKTKEAWKRPMLTVLVRGNAEENIITTCKTSLGGSGGGPVGTLKQCMDWGLMQSCVYTCDIPAST